MDVRPLIRGFIRNMPNMKSEWLAYIDPLFETVFSRPKTPNRSELDQLWADMPGSAVILLNGTLKGKRLVILIQAEDRSLIPDELRKVLGAQ